VESLWKNAKAENISETTWDFAAAGWISAADSSANTASTATCLANYEAQVIGDYDESRAAMIAETSESGIALDVL